MSPNIPAAWIDILHQVQRGDPTAILAGGAMRDWYLGRPVKDLDIFVRRHAEIDLSPFSAKLNETGERSAKLDETVVYQHIYNIPSGPPVNIIHCEEATAPLDRFRRFDFGLCQIAFDGKEIIKTDEFLWDVKYHQFTLRRLVNTEGLLYSMNRYHRLRTKYLWPLVIPETLALPSTFIGDAP